MVQWPSQLARSGQEAPQKAGSGLEAYPEGQERLGGTRGVSRGPPSGLKVVRRISRRARSGQKVFPKNREWSEGPPGQPGVAGSDLQALLEVQKWSTGPLKGPRVVGRPSRLARSGP